MPSEDWGVALHDFGKEGNHVKEEVTTHTTDVVPEDCSDIGGKFDIHLIGCAVPESCDSFEQREHGQLPCNDEGGHELPFDLSLLHDFYLLDHILWVCDCLHDYQAGDGLLPQPEHFHQHKARFR